MPPQHDKLYAPSKLLDILKLLENTDHTTHFQIVKISQLGLFLRPKEDKCPFFLSE